MKRLAAFFCFLAPAIATAQTMATTADGSRVWIRSVWYQAGEAPGSGDTSIYRFDPASTGDWTRLARVSLFNSISSIAATDDGSVLTWQRSQVCRSPCAQFGPTTQFVGLDKPNLIGTNIGLVLSRNGRFLLSPDYAGVTVFAIQDLETGRVWKAPMDAPTLKLPTPEPGIANDGSVAGLLDNNLVYWRPGGGSPPKLLLERPGLPQWTISADGRRVWIMQVGFQRRDALLLIDTGTGERTTILPSGPAWVRMNATASRLLFPDPADPTKLLLWESATRQSRPVLTGRGRISDAALSSDGRIAWVFDGDNALLRLDVDTGEASVAFTGLPIADRRAYVAVPGSALEMSLLGGVADDLEVTLAGARLQIIDTLPHSGIVVQVPWEASGDARDGGDLPLNIRRPGNPFEYRQNTQLQRSGVWPQLAFADLTAIDHRIKAVHQDFSALISDANPARSGETIHLYLYGLGPLDRPVPTGARGPADPPSRPLAPLACYLLGRDANPPAVGLKLPFVAYAPGLIGVYQVDATIPEGWPAGVHYVRCESSGKSSEGTMPIQ